MDQAEKGGDDDLRPNEQGAEDDRSQLIDRLQRERAEFQNYKHRIEQDRQAAEQRARADVIEQILPMLDELDRSFASLPQELADHPWVIGIVLSRVQLVDTLRQLGVDRIGEPGELFDPGRHEAVAFESRPNLDERRVDEIHRPGYALSGRLLRPAQVTVVGPKRDVENSGEQQGANADQADASS